MYHEYITKRKSIDEPQILHFTGLEKFEFLTLLYNTQTTGTAKKNIAVHFVSKVHPATIPNNIE